MELDMHERKKLTCSVAQRYRQATKKEKGMILDEFVIYTGYNRGYAAHLLSTVGKSVLVEIDGQRTQLIATAPSKRRRSYRKGGRPVIYDQSVVEVLRSIWEFLDYPCGKLLQPMIHLIMPSLDTDASFVFDETVRTKLLSISASSIDRLLKGDKKRLGLRGKALTKSGSLLKHQIPVRVFYSWDERMVGFFELDTVSHCGSRASGEFCRTLTLTDVCSGWTENKALRNMAHRWVKEEIIQVREQLAFKLLGIDSDNGGEFINYQLVRWCSENEITFTRGRPYRKNDNCFVEQKNGDFVRRTVGYYRFDSDQEYRALQQVYRYLCPLRNYWYPTIKISAKQRLENGRFKKIYDKPKTPYQRIMENEEVPIEAKEELTRRKQLTNPLELKRSLDKAVANLLTIHDQKNKAPGQQTLEAFG